MSRCLRGSWRGPTTPIPPEGDREVSLPGSGRPEQDHVLLAGHERGGRQVRDHVPRGAGQVLEGEVLEGLDLGEPGPADPHPGAVRGP